MGSAETYERPAIAGSGAIAIGLAASASAVADVRLLARSDSSAWRAEEEVEALCKKLEGADPSRVTVTTDVTDLTDCDLIVEAIAERTDAKVELHKTVASHCAAADLATTTSSLGVAALAREVGVPERFFGLHVFNPVTRMELIELCLPPELREGVAERAHGFCRALGKTAIEVPDQAGFVVNRLLFPYLFDAVRLLESSGMKPADVDSCMAMGAGHPMGPLKLLDFIGIDVSVAIGDSLYAESGERRHCPPALLGDMCESGSLGRKSGSGFYDY